MKVFLRTLTLVLTFCMLLSVIPAVNAQGQEQDAYTIVTKKLTVKYSAVHAGDYFAVDNKLYDGSGREIYTFPSSVYVYSLGVNCAVTVDLQFTTMTVYSLTGSRVELQSVYDTDYAFVMPYLDDYRYTTVLRSIEGSDYLSREILNSYGKTVVTADTNQYSLAMYLGGGIIGSLDKFGVTHLEFMDGDNYVKGVTVDDVGLYDADMISYYLNEKYGVLNNKGETVLAHAYDFACPLSTGYISTAQINLNAGTYTDCKVFNSDGTQVYAGENLVIHYNGHIAVEYDFNTEIYELKKASNGDVIASGAVCYPEVDYIFLSADEYTAGTVYTSEGAALVTGVYDLSADTNGTELIAQSAADGVFRRYDASGAATLAYGTEYVYALDDGVVYIGDDRVALAAGTRVISDYHEYYDGGAVLSGCEVYVFSDVNGDDNTQTLYVVDEYMYPFSDIYDEGYWAADGIVWAYESGFVDGVGCSTFAPDDKVTRAQIVTLLWRLEGCPAPQGQTGGGFTDVEAGTWYTDAIAWAAENGVVNGNGDGTFDPEGIITRQQFATLIFRYATEIDGKDTSARADVTGYVDAGEIESWARDAIEWCVAEGHMNGTSPETLSPTGEVTRAQLVTLVYRYSVPNWQELQ